MMAASVTAAQREASLDNARAFALLSTGAASIDLVGLELLKAKDVKHLPTTFFALEVCLGMFGNLLEMVLGPQHEIVISYQALWTLLKLYTNRS